MFGPMCMIIHSKVKLRMLKLNKSNVLSTFLLLEILLIYPYTNRYFDGQTHSFLTFNRVLWATITPIIIIALLNNTISLRSLTDKIFLVLILYLTGSLLFFAFFNQSDLTFVSRELSYSILPMFCYFIYKGNPKIDKDLAIFTILLVVFICGVSGLWGNSSLPKPYFIAVLENKSYVNFQSFYSPIIYASIGTICLAALLLAKIDVASRYKYFMIIIFFMTSILTLQRAAFLGLAMVIAGILLFRFNRYFLFYIPVLSACSFFLISNSLDFDTEFYQLLLSELTDFTLSSVIDQRQEQTFIFNNYSILRIIFGEGFGKYSPQNESAFLIMPDASYHRLFNELGIIGCGLFVFTFLLIFLDFLRTRNVFGLYLVTFVLVHFYFNRILMAIPSAYFIYIMLGLQVRAYEKRYCNEVHP